MPEVGSRLLNPVDGFESLRDHMEKEEHLPVHDSTKLELLKYSYWEHYKSAKDLALVLPLGHPKRVKIENEMNQIQKEIQEETNKA